MNRIACILLVLITNYHSFCQDSWIQREDFPGIGRWYPVGFALDNAVYIGLNSAGGDFYKFDLQTNEWSETSQIPGVSKEGAYAFGFDSVGIIVGGCCYSTEVWKYSPLNDTWTQLNPFPGNIKSYGVSWTYNSFGYICTGWSGDFVESKEFWKYNPTDDSWTQLPDFPGLERGFAAGFQIGSKGYLGTGLNGSDYYDDFWEYDMMVNQWTQLPNFPGSARYGMVGFDIGNSGYLGTGNGPSSSLEQDLWKFDPSNGSWEQKTDFPGGPLTIGIGISNGNRAFIGLGLDGSNFPKFFWEYIADTLVSINNNPIQNSRVNIFPNPADDLINVFITDMEPRKYMLEIFDLLGKSVGHYQLDNDRLVIKRSDIGSGMFFLQISDTGSGKRFSTEILIFQ